MISAFIRKAVTAYFKRSIWMYKVFVRTAFILSLTANF